MKKIFALTLAAVMTAGMTTVAFAAGPATAEVILATDSTTNLYVDVDGNGRFGDANETETGIVEAGSPVTFGRENGGSKVAIPLYHQDGTYIVDKNDIKGYKVKADWKVGKLDEKPVIDLVKINDGVTNDYVYAITFVLPDAAAVKTSDLAGSISIYKNSSDLKDTFADKDYITLNIGSEYGYNEEAYNTVADWAKVEVVNFKGVEGEETLAFGSLFEFEVDVTGQGKLNLKYNNKFNAEFGDMYDYANIDFITFEKSPSFNKTGVAYIYADEDAFIYEVTADGAKEIKGLKWDEDYEAWTFKTRTLGSYAISDVELDEKVVTDEKEESSKPASSSTGNTGKPNPDTGR